MKHLHGLLLDYVKRANEGDDKAELLQKGSADDWFREVEQKGTLETIDEND